MTQKDKKHFDEIFKSLDHFGNVTDCDLLRSACECEKLYDYLQSDGLMINGESDIKKYMHFAFWLGVIEGRKIVGHGIS